MPRKLSLQMSLPTSVGKGWKGRHNHPNDPEFVVLNSPWSERGVKDKMACYGVSDGPCMPTALRGRQEKPGGKLDPLALVSYYSRIP